MTSPIGLASTSRKQWPRTISQYPSDLTPYMGSSLVELLRGSETPVHTAPIYWEHKWNAAVRWGKWNLVREYEKPWELYDLETDRTELHDLSHIPAAKRDEMVALWEYWAREHQVAFPERFNMYQWLKADVTKQASSSVA